MLTVERVGECYDASVEIVQAAHGLALIPARSQPAGRVAR